MRISHNTSQETSSDNQIDKSPSLSRKKYTFLQGNKHDSIELALPDVFTLAEYYHQKHGITIYVHQHLAEKGISVGKYVSLDEDNQLMPVNQTDENKPANTHMQTDEDEDEDEDESIALEATAKALNDILSIQKTLSPNQYVGYIFVNDPYEYTHFECFIISQNHIIKPVTWTLSDGQWDHQSVKAEKFLSFPKYHYSFVDPESFFPNLVAPQADNESCASLSLSYLKNLLQKDAHQLHEFSLSIPYYNKNNQLRYFFIPSPFVLRYSQQLKYNEFIKNLLETDDTNNNCSLTKQLLECIEKTTALETTGEITESAKKTVIAQATLCLKTLPEFRKKWLDAYASTADKRKLMLADKYNRYLAYTARRLHTKSLLIHQSQHNPGLPILNTIRTMPQAEILDYLRSELPKIDFFNDSRTGIVYFLHEISSEFRIECFFILKAYTFNVYAWSAHSDFFDHEQISSFIDDLKQSPRISELILHDPEFIFSWLDKLNFSLEEKRDFIRLYLPLDAIQERLILLSDHSCYKFIQSLCDTLDNPHYLLEIISKETAFKLFQKAPTYQFSVVPLRFNPLLGLLNRLVTSKKFPDEVLDAFLMQHHTLFLQAIFSAPFNEYPFRLWDVLHQLQPFFDRTRFFDLNTSDVQPLLPNNITSLDEQKKILHIFNQLPLLTRQSLLSSVLEVSIQKQRRNMLLSILNAIAWQDRYAFLESVQGQSTNKMINKYNLYALFHEPGTLDIDNIDPLCLEQSDISTEPSQSLPGRKRPYGEASDFDFFFFPNKKAPSTHTSTDNMSPQNEPERLPSLSNQLVSC